MGRIGITQEDVNKAVEALISKGAKVSQESVKDEIGRGSFASIGPMLRSWRADQEASARPAIDLPASVHSVAQQAIQRIWAAAAAAAQAELGPERDAFEYAKAQATAEVEECQDVIRRLESELDAVSVREAVAQHRIQELARMNGVLQAQTDSLQDAHSKWFEAERAITRLQVQLEVARSLVGQAAPSAPGGGYPDVHGLHEESAACMSGDGIIDIPTAQVVEVVLGPFLQSSEHESAN